MGVIDPSESEPASLLSWAYPFTEKHPNTNGSDCRPNTPHTFLMYTLYGISALSYLLHIGNSRDIPM